MGNYRLYAVTRDNHIMGVPADVACENDGEALHRAERLLDGYDIEVWEGNRRIDRVKAKSEIGWQMVSAALLAICRSSVFWEDRGNLGPSFKPNVGALQPAERVAYA
jgi:hypothetical protein